MEKPFLVPISIRLKVISEWCERPLDWKTVSGLFSDRAAVAAVAAVIAVAAAAAAAAAAAVAAVTAVAAVARLTHFCYK